MTRDNVALEAVADALAHAAHAGQRRRHGADYIDHPRAVTALATDLGAVVGLPLSSVSGPKGTISTRWCPGIAFER